MFCIFETSRKIKGASITPTYYLHVATTYKGPQRRHVSFAGNKINM